MKRLKIHHKTFIAWVTISTLFSVMIFRSTDTVLNTLLASFIMILTVAFIGGKIYKDFIKSKYYVKELDKNE